MNTFIKEAMMHPGVEFGIRYSERRDRVTVMIRQFGYLPRTKTFRAKEFSERFFIDGLVDEKALEAAFEDVMTR